VTTSVELLEFKAEFEPGKTLVNVHWSTANERDNVGFDLYRSTRMNGEYRKVNDDLITESMGDGYIFTDYSVEAGRTYYYKLVAIDNLGNENEFGPIKVQVPVPEKFVLFQNYPNPFNPVTSIRFEIPVRSSVNLTIYNIMGQDIVTLIDEERNAGYYTAEWDGLDRYGQEVPSGIYIYRLATEKQTITHRMVKMR
jgi:hypothetical protein